MEQLQSFDGTIGGLCFLYMAFGAFVAFSTIRLSARLSLVRFAGKEFKLQALLACALCVAAVAIYQAPKSQQSGFAIIGLMLLSVALFTPYIIWTLFTSFSYTLRWVKVRWFLPMPPRV